MKALLFLNLGFGEILFILIMYLIFFGSKNIPSLARNIGSSIRKIKDSSNNIRKEIKESIFNSKD
tara:strand:+ start:608 stop:802 length:195 start_codon:yes stop_codon:yes gene_type:complete